MLLRRKWFPLLFTGLLASSFLALYFVKVENSGSSIFEDTSCKQPTIHSKENAESHFLSPAEELFKLYDGVETFVMFIGYQRSSHSLVGAILDAHPEIIIPGEFDLMTRWKKYQAPELIQNNLQKYALFYDLHRLSMKQAMFGIRANFNNTKPTGESTAKYTYHVPGLWQGGYQNKIKVIGDKKGGVTSGILMDPRSMSELGEISQLVQVPMKFIHVTRNPFDNIATMTLLKSCSRNAAKEFEAGEKVSFLYYVPY